MVFEDMLRNLDTVLCNIRTLNPARINANAIPDSVVINKLRMF
jgi:hypothetical protein